MIVDTSALVAVLYGEPEARDFVERIRAAEITRVVEIGRQAGHDQHGRAEPRQAPPSGARERERRKSMCERFHDFVL